MKPPRIPKHGAVKSRTTQQPKKLTWFDLLSQKHCTNCSLNMKPVDHGPSRSFCPLCTANLPPVVSLHLDRALTNRWFLAWWRFACQILRNQPVKLPDYVMAVKKRA